MEKILITGGTGFLGRHLASVLSNNCAQTQITICSSKNCDLRKQDSLDQFSNTKFDKIFHLAAWTQAGDFCLYHTGEQWIINQQINTNVLTWWKEKQPQAKLIAIGSSCCYEPGMPHSEENFLRGIPIESLLTYAMTKRMLYNGLLALNKQFGLKYLFVIPSTLYGPDYHVGTKQMHFIFDLMRKIVDAKRTGSPVELWGDGFQKRELIHVQDFVSAMLELSKKHDNEIVNIGSGSEYSIREFAELLCNLVGFDSKNIAYNPSKFTGAKEKFLRIDKLKRLLPDFKAIDLKQGLAQTVKWYMDYTKPTLNFPI